MKIPYITLAILTSITTASPAPAQTTSPFESIVWGATLDADSQITYICDLHPNTNWSGNITSQGSPAGNENAFTNAGQLEYTIDPTGTHTFAASFVATGTPDETNNSIISHSCLSMRFTIQVIANEPFTFESAACATVSPNAIAAGPGVGAVIHAAPQRWIINNRCNLEPGNFINIWDADTSVIFLGDRVDQVGNEPLVAQLIPGVQPDETSPHYFSTGLGTTTGTLPAGTYTFSMYAATDTSNAVPTNTSGEISLRLAPASNPCPADLNNDSTLNFFDISAFIKLQPDFNNDGQFNFFDVSSFITAFAVGCHL